MAELAAGRLPFPAYVDAVAEEADRLLAAAARALDAPVPTCPGWTAADLVAHVARVYRHWTVQLEAGDPGTRAEPPGEVDGSVEGLEAALTALCRRLVAAGPDAPAWNWSDADHVAAWVARRMACETAVHRVDAELAAGRATPVETELAVDGLEERIAVHLATDVPEAPGATLGGSACLVCDDADAAFVVEVGGGRLRWRAGRGPADVVLVGSASNLFLFSWNRVDPAGLAVTGDPAVAGAWAGLPV